MFWNKKKAEHKLVCIGDSITQGFQNGGIYRTELSYPAFLADCFEPPGNFRIPRFSAQAGIPLNLEVLIRGLSDIYGNHLNWQQYLPAALHLYSTIRRIKHYWEENPEKLRRKQNCPYHNQSVWGFTIKDAWVMTEKKCRDYIENNRTSYSIFDILPDHAMYITARCVLNPTLGKTHQDYNMIDNVKRLEENGGIENLIVYMGHNNIIGAITSLKFKYSEEYRLNKLPAKRDYTVYRPEHFEKDYRRLAEKVSKIGVQRIFTATIPYVTIPPAARGVNADLSRERGGYFDYYTHFWIWDEDFDPEVHPHLTREQAIEMDQVVDEYNKIIRDVASEYGWIVVPVHHYVNSIAYRRKNANISIPFPKGFTNALKRNPDTRHFVDNPDQFRLSTEYLQLDQETGDVRRGGIFSLDGIHPSTIGYGLMANLFYKTMKKHGVHFAKPLDWDYIIANDTLVTDPPYLLLDLRDLLHFLSMGHREKFTELGTNLLMQIMELFSYRNGRQQSSQPSQTVDTGS